MNPHIAAFFSATAGLEKFINAVLAVVAAYVATIEALPVELRAMIVGIIGAVQMLYTTNTSQPSPPETAPVADLGPVPQPSPLRARVDPIDTIDA